MSTNKTGNIFQALARGGTEVLEAVGRSPLPPADIAAKTGMDEGVVEERIRVLVECGLLTEEDGGYRRTLEGEYMAAVLFTVEEDMKVLRGGGGLERLTILHTGLARRLRERKVDIMVLADRTRKSLELTKRNIELLMDILP
jgi:DNA-binding transcriptional ArsR family regulator